MKRTKQFKGVYQFIYCLLALALVACGNSKHIEEIETEIEKEQVKENTSSILWVNSYKSDCSRMAQLRYFFLTQEGAEKPVGNWDCLYENIEGFDFEEGYIYQLKVEKIMVEGKPGLKYLETISKERDADYFKLYDIWAATHINQEVLEVSATRPNMEINLSTMKVMGKGMCNQYFGKIESYTPSTISFGPLAGTKMMCPEITIEDAFLAALQTTESFRIEGLKLSFYDSEDEEVLRFQKID